MISSVKTMLKTERTCYYFGLYENVLDIFVCTVRLRINEINVCFYYHRDLYIIQNIIQYDKFVQVYMEEQNSSLFISHVRDR